MSSTSMLIDLHYLPCIEYFACLLKYDTICIETHEHYQKQSYRNRCCILTANKIVTLSVPVLKGNSKQNIKDVQIDYNQKWVTDHWRTICSAYGKAPFFDYFAPYFQDLFLRKYKFLFDLNFELLTICLSLIKIDKKIFFSEKYKKQAETGQDDFRAKIHPKIPYSENDIYQPVRYLQNFGNNFAPNLSIIDVLFCEGNHSQSLIRQSLITN
jgi:hypothetical protein